MRLRFKSRSMLVIGDGCQVKSSQSANNFLHVSVHGSFLLLVSSESQTNKKSASARDVVPGSSLYVRIRFGNPRLVCMRVSNGYVRGRGYVYVESTHELWRTKSNERWA